VANRAKTRHLRLSPSHFLRWERAGVRGATCSVRPDRALAYEFEQGAQQHTPDFRRLPIINSKTGNPCAAKYSRVVVIRLFLIGAMFAPVNLE